MPHASHRTAADATASPGAPDLHRAQKRRRLSLAAIVAVAAAFALFARSSWGSGSAVHEIVEFAGLALIVACMLGRTWCTLYIGGRKKHVLVTDGPFSLCRNPLYVFSTLGAAGIGLTTGSIVVGLVLGLAIGFVFDRVVRREEEWLLAHHGAAYADYCAATPRWLPRLRNWKDTEMVEARPRLLAITFREASLLLIALPAMELVEWLQGAGWLPVLLNLP